MHRSINSRVPGESNQNSSIGFASLSNLKVFVAGVHPKSTTSSISTYFGKFGGIVHIEGVDNKLKEREERQTGSKNHFCILTCQDKQTMSSILAHQEHYLDGRKLFCSVHMTGLHLIMHNHKVNKRRAVIRKVPISVSNQELHDLMVSVAGPVETIFQFLPASQKSIHARRHLSYSVTFADKESLNKLLKVECLRIKGQVVVVEKYNLKKKPEELQAGKGVSKRQQKLKDSILNQNDDHLNDETGVHSRNSQTMDDGVADGTSAANESSKHKMKNIITSSSFNENEQLWNEDRTNNSRTNREDDWSSGLLADEETVLKPTMKMYHVLNSCIYQLNLQNIRLNICSKWSVITNMRTIHMNSL